MKKVQRVGKRREDGEVNKTEEGGSRNEGDLTGMINEQRETMRNRGEENRPPEAAELNR